MHALNLHVEDEIRRQIDALSLLNQAAELFFFEALDLIELLHVLIGQVFLELANQFQIGEIPFADAGIQIVA
ncbi:hypothetical protein SDC9_171859 [bioreactor metagenome]|uniref:Uncharacterized protein n=1 Tax=bioreactor metagenome TaxID=1076179 RepID=A0A645GEE4_9ZZZZ